MVRAEGIFADLMVLERLVDPVSRQDAKAQRRRKERRERGKGYEGMNVY
jgi:hypothetical protein